MELLILIYLFTVGTACGSFALVLADRMHSGRNWVKGRSACEHCKHKLGPLDLVPIFSWATRLGKCRYCKKSIGVSYPITELFTGLSFGLSYYFLPYDLTSVAMVAMFVVWLISLVLMTALLVFDFRWQLLPTKLIVPLYILGGLHTVLNYTTLKVSLFHYISAVIASVAVSAGVFALLFALSKGRWIGDGDIRFGVVIGLFVADPLLAWAVLFTASLYGLAFALPQLSKSSKKLSLKIPFGPFLILSLITVYLFGSSAVNWYLDTFIYFS